MAVKVLRTSLLIQLKFWGGSRGLARCRVVWCHRYGTTLEAQQRLCRNKHRLISGARVPRILVASAVVECELTDSKLKVKGENRRDGVNEDVDVTS